MNEGAQPFRGAPSSTRTMSRGGGAARLGSSITGAETEMVGQIPLRKSCHHPSSARSHPFKLEEVTTGILLDDLTP